MALRYRDTPRSPAYPHRYVGGERENLSVCSGDMVRVLEESGDSVLVQTAAGESFRCRPADLQRDRWREPEC